MFQWVKDFFTKIIDKLDEIISNLNHIQHNINILEQDIRSVELEVAGLQKYSECTGPGSEIDFAGIADIVGIAEDEGKRKWEVLVNKRVIAFDTVENKFLAAGIVKSFAVITTQYYVPEEGSYRTNIKETIIIEEAGCTQAKTITITGTVQVMELIKDAK